MRDYGKVHSSFWTSETIRSMSEDARSLAFYLLTSPHGTISGVFRLPDGYVTDDIQWSCERVIQAFSELVAKGFANRCETTKWVWVKQHFKWNKLENPNQFKSALKIAQTIPVECTWKQEYARLNAEYLGISVEPLPNPSATLAQPVTVTVTEAVPVTETVAVVPSAAENSDGGTKVIDTEFQNACRETWNTYAEAYLLRYSVEPTRNKTINSQVKNFVQRIGRVEAPSIAAWFISHNDQFYVRGGHVFGLLTKDAEKLRTEWATGRTMNSTKARQVEKSTNMVETVNEIIEQRKQA